MSSLAYKLHPCFFFDFCKNLGNLNIAIGNRGFSNFVGLPKLNWADIMLYFHSTEKNKFQLLRWHLSRQHLSWQHLSRQHLSRQHLSRQHLSRQHLSWLILSISGLSQLFDPILTKLLVYVSGTIFNRRQLSWWYLSSQYLSWQH